MRCYANQLSGQLKQGLAPFYLVLGDEPFQVDDCVRQIQHAARSQGFDEVIRFALSPQFDWQEVLHQYHSMSLFSARTLLEIDFNGQKAGQSGAKALQSLAESLNPDVLLIIRGLKASQETQRSAWFKALDKQGIFIPCYPLTGQHLARWLDQQCAKLTLTLTGEAKTRLLQATEGNLLATFQELEKLSLLHGTRPVDEQSVLAGLLNQSKFDIFDLSDALLKGHAEQALRVLTRLSQDNTEVTAILWAVNKEVQILLALFQAQSEGLSPADAFKQQGVWKNQQPLAQQALNRLNMGALKKLLIQLAQFDVEYKRGNLVAPYQALAQIMLGFCRPLDLPLPCYPDAG